MIANLTLIQTFYQVAHLGSYSAAARNLGLSYQSAANHVRRLEQVVEGRLVESEKGSKQVVLTLQGRVLYNLLHHEIEPMLKRLSLVIQKERPLLRIGLPQAAFFYLFPRVLHRLQQDYPDIEIQAVERDTMLQELVSDGSLDVCISESYFGDPKVPQRLLGAYHLSLIFPKSWEAPSPLDNISAWAKDKHFVTYEPGQTLRNVAIDYLTSSGVEPIVSVSTSGSSSVKRCVEAGLGYSIVPSWCIEPKEPQIKSLVLEDLEEVRIYFGQAQFMLDNIYVKSLYEACREFISTQVLE